MSEEQSTDAVVSLEEVFRSRDFGRRPSRWGTSTFVTVDPADPPQLEHVFLSELFGHPEAIARTGTTTATTGTTPAERPTLVLLAGRGSSERDLTRYRGAIGAVSGVAAAAFVVASLSTGTGQQPGQPTISAQGPPPGHGAPSPGGSGQPGGVVTEPSTSGGGTNTSPFVTAISGGGATVAQLASLRTPPPQPVVAQVPPPSEVAPPPPPEVVPPPPPPPGGGGVLKPVLSAVGNTVSAVGSTVTKASNALGSAVPAVAPVTGMLGSLGSTVSSLGQSVAGV